MNRQTPRPPLDDEALGRLVHDVADEWAMPPVRLDQPAWRERVRHGRGRPRARAGAWLWRMVGAAGAAVALTVAVALVGVWLTLPRPLEVGQPGPTGTAKASPAPTVDGTTPRPSRAPAPTGLPALVVDGDMPSPARIVVQTQEGHFAMADLATGKVSAPFAAGQGGSRIGRAPDGTLFCVCILVSRYLIGTPTRATVSLNRYDADGKASTTTPVGEFNGQPDPRDGPVVPEEPSHVGVEITFGDDGRTAYVGWSERAHPVWRSGVLVLDLLDGTVADSFELPATTTGEDDVRRLTNAPGVVGRSGSRLIISRPYYTWTPPAAEEPSHQFGLDVFTIDRAPGEQADGQAQPLAGAQDCGDYVEQAGGTPDGGLWLVCRLAPGTNIVRRIDADGRPLADARVASARDIDGVSSAVSPDGSALYLWHPVDLRLTRVALASGELDSFDGPKLAANDDVLAALGRWLVPSAQAKMLLRSGVAVSPDGRRVYALGVNRSGTRDEGGSAGVFAFDMGGDQSVERWPATADFVSLAVSGDGRFVYAAGMPGVNASGRRASQPASITVYDSATGDVRLIAGSLSQQMLTFPATVLP